MHKPISIRKAAAVLAIVTLALLVSVGCSYRQYYLLEPSVFDETLRKDKDHLTDADVVGYADAVKTMLRDRMNRARLARSGGGVLQVLTAAVSAMVMGLSGGSAAGASTVLSGTSAVIPEVSDVIGAKERAELYSDGVRMVENAQALYVKAVAETEEGKISRAKLTLAGATLYETVVAAIHVVEGGLTGLLPTVEQLQKARSNVNKIELIPTTVSLDPGQTTTVQVSQGGPATTAASDNDAIASAQLISNGSAAQITAGAVPAGKATITFTNAGGGSRTVTVRVPTTPFSLSANAVDVEEGKTSAPITVVSGPPVVIAQSNNANVATVVLDSGGGSVTITGVKAGKAIMRLENKSGRSDTVDVTVKPKGG